MLTPTLSARVSAAGAGKARAGVSGQAINLLAQSIQIALIFVGGRIFIGGAYRILAARPSAQIYLLAAFRAKRSVAAFGLPFHFLAANRAVNNQSHNVGKIFAL